MRKRLADSVRLIAGPILALATLIAMPSTSRGQLYTTDPYTKPSDFRNYVYPRGGNEFAAGYSPRSGGSVAPNQLDGSFGNSLDMPYSGRGGRYDNAFRRYDSEFSRIYTPNERADTRYLEERDRREADRIRAMTERDPKKRAQILRELDKDSKKQSSDLNLSVRRGGSPATVATAPTRRAPRNPATMNGRTQGTTTGRSAPATEAPTRRSSNSGANPSSRANPAARGTGTEAAPTRNRAATGGGASPSDSNSRRSQAAPRASDRTSSNPTDVLRRSRERESAGRPATDDPASNRPR